MLTEPAVDPKELPSRTTKTERNHVTARVRIACDAMVWEGLDYAQAAAKAKLHIRSMRLALSRPIVLAYLKQARMELLQSERARNIQRFMQIRDAADNMPAVNAGLALERIAGESTLQAQHTTMPGLVIQIAAPSTHSGQQVAMPLITQQPVGSDDEQTDR